MRYTYAIKDPSFIITEDEKASLSKRHLEFWEYYSKKEFEKSYALELPHLRFEKSLPWYKNFYADNKQGYTITQLSITLKNKYHAIVQSRLQDSEGTNYIFPDYWVLVEGKWYHYFEFSKLPSPNKPF
jgi:hypothetical protein